MASEATPVKTLKRSTQSAISRFRGRNRRLPSPKTKLSATAST